MIQQPILIPNLFMDMAIILNNASPKTLKTPNLLHIIGSAYANAILGKEDHVKMVKYLIDNGSEVNAVTNAGNTALGFAAR